ncbi:MAG TPA: non-homologous end-joining DNA ligase [Solirubrobacterales bacterium]|nr:non-homologous end-joining DNA ligase [Solirubrobacterales bacterium]
MSALDALAEADQDRIVEAGPPAHAAPMKAVLTDRRFSDPGWIFERKLDGIRCIAIRDGASVRLLSRNDLPLDDRYPEIAAAVAAASCERFTIDGEVVAFDGRQTSFALLARRKQFHVPVFLYAFDLLWLDGFDVRRLPLRSRKRLLRRGVGLAEPIRVNQYRNERGEELFAEACRKGWEGLIAKRAASTYTARRSRDWLKLKCEQGQELVIGGYTDPKGARSRFGALLLGHWEDGELRYAGRVGTGFDEATLESLGRRLEQLAVPASPFADPRSIDVKGAHWVDPVLVAEIGFTEWTRDGRLRHPRFLGLRDDKAAAEVVREQ